MMAALDHDALSRALTGFLQRHVSLQCPEDTSMYTVEGAFAGRPYWEGDVCDARFERTLYWWNFLSAADCERTMQPDRKCFEKARQERCDGKREPGDWEIAFIS